MLLTEEREDSVQQVFKNKFSTSDYKKYSKQIILKKFGIIGQKKIFSSKILIIGMGGLGCPLSIYLASLGVGNLGIVDNDKVELSNLNRQILYTKKDLGKFKVEVARRRIKKLNTKINLNVYKLKLDKKNINKIFNNYDIICDCTDNFESRLLINDFCLKQNKVLISAAVSGFDGHLFKFNFKKKIPCYRCFMPDIPEINYNCETEGVIPPLTGILGTLQANEVLNTILNFNSDLESKFLIFDSKKMNFRKAKILKNKNCVNKC